MGKRRIEVGQLEVGMIVVDDVYSSRDQLIVPKNTFVTEKVLSKIRAYEIPAVHITEKKTEMELEGEENQGYLEKIRVSDEFHEFNDGYHVVEGIVKRILQQIAKEKTVPDLKGELFPEIDKLYQSVKSNTALFDMLHAMRDQADAIYIHSINVALISSILGKWLRFSIEDISTLVLAGIIHDIGKLSIPEKILAKPFKLTDKEMQIVRSHAAKGYRMIKNLDLDEDVKLSVLMHHERCDGSGYPIGMKGERINRFAKIIAIADVYDAMTSSRIYRDCVCPFDVIEQFEQDGFQLYEIEYIITFLDNIANTYMNSYVKLSNGEFGEIILLNHNKISRPVVKIGETYMDLSKTPDVKIEAIL